MTVMWGNDNAPEGVFDVESREMDTTKHLIQNVLNVR